MLARLQAGIAAFLLVGHLVEGGQHTVDLGGGLAALRIDDPAAEIFNQLAVQALHLTDSADAELLHSVDKHVQAGEAGLEPPAWAGRDAFGDLRVLAVKYLQQLGGRSAHGYRD
ncbi:hypothetical protein D3C86_1836630 [compost metagenome]